MPFANLTYRIASLVHFQPREEAVLVAVHRICSETDSVSRIVDIGCGPGFLSSSVVKNGLSYLGLDSEISHLKYAENKHNNEERIKFRLFHAGTEILNLKRSDIVVLNGVAHHLEDSALQSVLHSSMKSSGLIICDHFRDQASLSSLSRKLQDLDRGKYIRDHSKFLQLSGYRTLNFSKFMIRFAGLSFWPYFCASYQPITQGN